MSIIIVTKFEYLSIVTFKYVKFSIDILNNIYVDATCFRAKCILVICKMLHKHQHRHEHFSDMRINKSIGIGKSTSLYSLELVQADKSWRNNGALRY